MGEEAFDAGCPEHARLAFTLVSTLRWHEGALGDAHRLSLRAELASRGTDDRNRAIGIAETARCLVILERDLAQAESLLLEARAMLALCRYQKGETSRRAELEEVLRQIKGYAKHVSAIVERELAAATALVGSGG